MWKPSEKLSAKTVMTFTQIGVYGWWRAGRYLYIGASNNILRRVSTHNVIGKVSPLEYEDEIHVWLCQTVAEAETYELNFQRRHRPIYNSQKRINQCIAAHNPMKYRKRCRWSKCRKLFWTDVENAKHCPGTNHGWKAWEEKNPRATGRPGGRPRKRRSA